jgi:hypothetical protein
VVASALRVTDSVAEELKQMLTRKLSRDPLKTDPGSSESVEGGRRYPEAKKTSYRKRDEVKQSKNSGIPSIFPEGSEVVSIGQVLVE